MINYYELKVSIFKKLFLLNCMKILISGGMGFLGSHLTESLLSENHKIILISKSLSKKNNIKLFEKRIVIEKINVKNTLKMEKIILKLFLNTNLMSFFILQAKHLILNHLKIL